MRRLRKQVSKKEAECALYEHAVLYLIDRPLTNAEYKRMRALGKLIAKFCETDPQFMMYALELLRRIRSVNKANKKSRSAKRL